MTAALALSLEESTSPCDRAISQILNAGAAQAGIALDLIGNTLLKNVLAEPSNPKFRSIKLANAKLGRMVFSVPGGQALLCAAGFAEQGEQLVLPDDADLAPLKSVQEHIAELLAMLPDVAAPEVAPAPAAPRSAPLPQGDPTEQEARLASITGISVEQARLALQATGGDIEVAAALVLERGSTQLPGTSAGCVDAAPMERKQQLTNPDASSDEVLFEEAKQLANAGTLKQKQGDARGALQLYEQALACGRRITNTEAARIIKGGMLGDLGRAYNNLGQHERAIEYSTQALEIIGDRRKECSILGDLAIAHAELRQYDLAIKRFSQALAISREIGDRRKESAWLTNLSNVYESLGQIERAIEHQTQALTISRKIGDRSSEVYLLGIIGQACLKLDQHEQAIEHLVQAVAISQEVGDRRGEGNYLGDLGRAYYSLGQHEHAVEYFTQGLKISQEIGDRAMQHRFAHVLSLHRNLEANRNEAVVEESKQLLGAAQLKQQRGDAKGALRLYEQSLACAPRITDAKQAKAVEAPAHRGIGDAYVRLDQYERAVEHYTQSLERCKEIGHRENEGIALGNLGAAYFFLGEHERAIKLFKQALVINKEVGYREGESANLGQLGSAYRSLGQYERAIEYTTQALAISEETGDRHGEATALGNLAGAYGSLGQHEHALEHHTRALTISREVGDRRLEGSFLGNLGSTHRQLGQHEHAIKYHTEALTVSKEIGSRELENNQLGCLATAYSRLGLNERAIEYETQALAISREIRNRWSEGLHLDSLGIFYGRLDQNERAIEHHTQALAVSREVGNRQGEGKVLLNLGCAYSCLNQFERAIEHLTQALAISREIGDQGSEAYCLDNLGNTYLLEAYARESGFQGDHERAVNGPAAALPLLQQARDIHDKLWAELNTDERRVSFGDTYVINGRGLQAAHARLGQPAAALEAAEHASSRAFELLLAQQRVARGASPAAASATDAATAPQGSDALLEVATRQGVTIVVFSLIGSSLLLAWVVRGGTPLAMKQIGIPKSEKSIAQLIELTRRTIGARARQGEATASSAAEQASPSMLAPPMVDEAALEEALAACRDLTLDDDDDDDATIASPTPARPADPTTELLRRCHELLIAPLGLVDGEPLLLVPDRDLYALPFAALIDADGKHLIERHTLRVAPSVGTVIQLEEGLQARTAPSKLSALVVGDPAFHGWAGQLPGAKAEARDVAAALSASAAFKSAAAVTSLIGDAATKPAVVEAMRHCDVIHLATHGVPDGVLLGGATREKGKLSMAEVQSLELRARLVVLSECDSFRGKLSSDGVIGITRAFVAAGALTLVASLWKVDDAATKALMQRFYARLLEGGAVGDATVAMQGAMVSMIRDGHWTVLQWAAFVVYGLASVDLTAARTQSPAVSTPPQDASVFEDQPTILQLIATARADPSTLQPSLATLAANEPHLVQLVQQHQAEFVALLNSAAPPAPASEP